MAEVIVFLFLPQIVNGYAKSFLSHRDILSKPTRVWGLVVGVYDLCTHGAWPIQCCAGNCFTSGSHSDF